jgi:hypothetical protein
LAHHHIPQLLTLPGQPLRHPCKGNRKCLQASECRRRNGRRIALVTPGTCAVSIGRGPSNRSEGESAHPIDPYPIINAFRARLGALCFCTPRRAEPVESLLSVDTGHDRQGRHHAHHLSTSHAVHKASMSDFAPSRATSHHSTHAPSRQTFLTFQNDPKVARFKPPSLFGIWFFHQRVPPRKK